MSHVSPSVFTAAKCSAQVATSDPLSGHARSLLGAPRRRPKVSQRLPEAGLSILMRAPPPVLVLRRVRPLPEHPRPPPPKPFRESSLSASEDPCRSPGDRGRRPHQQRGARRDGSGETVRTSPSLLNNIRRNPPLSLRNCHVGHRDDQTPSTPAVWGSRGGIGHPEAGLYANRVQGLLANKDTHRPRGLPWGYA